LYAPILDAFFIFDDISILTVATPLGGARFCDHWLPIENGFWRPIPLSIAWLLVKVFGPWPFASHLIPVLSHVFNSMLVGMLARNRGLRPLSAGAVALFYAGHFAAFPAVSMMQNLMDVLFGTGVLLTLLVVDGGRGTVRLGRLAVVFLLGLACKETAMVLPFVATVWWMASARPSAAPEEMRANKARLVALNALGVLAIIAIVALQLGTQHSYVGDGRLLLHPQAMVRQACDYLLSGAFPYFHLVALPIGDWHFSHGFLWLLRAGVAGCFLALALLALRHRVLNPLAFGVIALATISPATLLAGPPEGRFVYAAIGPILLLGVELFLRSRRPMRIVMLTLGGISAALSVYSFRWSPSMATYLRTANEVELLVAEVGLHAAQWKKGERVAIIAHPHPGAPALHWTYGQQLLLLFQPDSGVLYALDDWRTADHTYLYSQGRLLELQPPVE